MEIERKFTLKSLPDNLESYPSHHIEQVYLNYNPVVRARKQDDEYYLTYKGSGMMARDESNLPLNEVSYYHLREKADGSVISKRRYLIPLQHPGFKEGFPTPPADYSLTIELDVFDAPFAPLIMAEVEFGSKEAAEAFAGYCASKEGQTAWVQTIGGVSASPEIESAHPVAQEISVSGGGNIFRSWQNVLTTYAKTDTADTVWSEDILKVMSGEITVDDMMTDVAAIME